jgi:hypothetical protein
MTLLSSPFAPLILTPPRVHNALQTPSAMCVFLRVLASRSVVFHLRTVRSFVGSSLPCYIIPVSDTVVSSRQLCHVQYA